MDKEKPIEKYIITSRAQGFIISTGGMYMIYHTGKTRMAWKTVQEQQMQFRAASLIGKSTAGQYGAIELNNCIIYGESDDPFVEMFTDDTTKVKSSKFKYASLENGYKNTYFLPYTTDGQYMTDIMTHENWQADIVNYFLESDNALSLVPYYSVADLSNEENPVFVFCVPNVTRLNAFLMTAEIASEEYHIYCFDFQIEFLKRVVDGRAKIFSIPFEEFKADFHVTNSTVA